jgi:hypothetical protein
MFDDTLEMKHKKTLTFSAASGLVKIGSQFYSVGDDQQSLEIFSENPGEESRFLQLLPEVLPMDPKERKRWKADFEVLVHLERQTYLPFGALMALPSGSTPQRGRGVVVPLLENQELSDTRIIFDLGDLYAFLLGLFPLLNIEGAVVQGSRLKLFQRGNGTSSQNAVIDVDLRRWLKELEAGLRISAACFMKAAPITLPKLEGIQTGFTDACEANSQPDSDIWFLAAAEDTPSTYDDGPFHGALLGRLNSSNEIVYCAHLDITEKPEGLCLDPENPNTFYVVTDTDSPSKPSGLFKGHFRN